MAYGQIPRRHRAAKHQAVAKWLEDRGGDRVADHAEVLAHHYEAARRLLISCGLTEETRELDDLTVRFYVLAGERAIELDVTRAQRHFERALESIPPQDALQGSVLLGLARIAGREGRTDEAIARLEEAMHVFRTTRDPHGEGAAMARLSQMYHWATRGAEARTAASKAIRLLEKAEPSRELAYAYVRAAMDADSQGAPADTLSWAEKAIGVAESVADVPQGLWAHAVKGAALCQLGDHSGLTDLRTSYEECLRLGLGELSHLTCSWFCDSLWRMHGPASALPTYEEILERSERRGLWSAVMDGRAESLWMLHDAGEWDSLLQVGHEVVKLSQQRKYEMGEMKALPSMAHVLTWRQRLDQARILSKRSLLQARRAQDLQTLVPALAVGAFIAHVEGDRSAALVLIEELKVVTRHSGLWRSRELPTVLRMLVASGDVKEAERFAAGVEVTMTRDRNCVLTGQAILTEAKGEVEKARDLYQKAAQRWADYGFVLEEGQAHVGLARCLIALGDEEAATVPLQKARAIFSRLGAVPLLDEVDHYLGEATALNS